MTFGSDGAVTMNMSAGASNGARTPSVLGAGAFGAGAGGFARRFGEGTLGGSMMIRMTWRRAASPPDRDSAAVNHCRADGTPAGVC